MLRRSLKRRRKCKDVRRVGIATPTRLGKRHLDRTAASRFRQGEINGQGSIVS